MTVEDWKVLAKKAEAIYADSVKKTLELFPFDDAKTLEIFNSLPSAVGKSVVDFGNPTKFPRDVYKKSLPDTVKEFTEKDPSVLLRELQAGKYTVTEVLKHYFHAALFASKLTNAIFEFLPEESLAIAKQLDSDFESSHTKPLFGLPISIKEHIPLKGKVVSAASLCFIDRVVDYDAYLVRITLEAGGVPFVRTTNPQSLMMLECESYTHGRTVNALNGELTSGGSSGGEGTINGIGAATLGIGSDIGGSIRAPAAFNGVYGLKPTVGRIPDSDFLGLQSGSEAIYAVPGPLTRSLELLELSMKTFIDAKPWLVDPSLNPLPWTTPTQKKWRIGILKTDNIVNPLPPIKRALDLVEKKLSSLDNVEVVTFEALQHHRVFEIAKLYFEDGGRDTRSTFTKTGEPVCPQTQWTLDILGDELDVHEIWSLNIKKQQYRKDYAAHWTSYTNEAGEGLDVIIAPIFPGPAPKHRTAKYAGYTVVWNILDYPVLSIPVTTVDNELDLPDNDYKPTNEYDQFVYDSYDSPLSFEKAPVGLGIVGLKNTDEKVVEVAKILRDLL